MRKVALFVALVLVFAFASWRSSQAPLTVTCGSVAGGTTMTAKGTGWAHKFGTWVHTVAENPEQYRDSHAVKEVIDGVAKDVLLYWVKAAFQSARGDKIDPQILKLEQDAAKNAADAETACTPCPTVQGGQDAGAPLDTVTAVATTQTTGGSDRAAIVAAASRYPWDVRTAVAIAGAESGFRADPGGRVVAGSHMRGAWQINEQPHADLFPGRDWRNIADNAWMAYQVYRQAGGSFQPWSTYTSGSYKSHLDPSLPSQRGSARVDVPSTESGQEIPTPGCVTGSGQPGMVVGSWNAEYGNGKSNVFAGVRAVAARADVFGLQEMGDDTLRRITASQTSGFTMSQDGTAVPIFWKTAKYQVLKQGRELAFPAGRRVEYSPSDRSTTAGPKFVTYVLLQDKATGQKVAVVNTHMLVGAYNGKVRPKRQALYRRQIAAMVKVSQQFRAQGIPVVSTGDYNAPTTTTVPGMAAAGFTANWQTLTSGATHGGRSLDYVWAAGATPSSQTTLGGFGSDHRPLLVTFQAVEPEFTPTSVTVARTDWNFPGQRSVDDAIAWMQQQDANNSSGWGRRCLAAVGQAYGQQGTTPVAGHYYATGQWDAMPARYRHPGSDAPPRGALVFWDTDIAAGHIAISNGDGRVWTTDPPGNYGQISLVPIEQIDGWGQRLGYGPPYFVGKTQENA